MKKSVCISLLTVISSLLPVGWCVSAVGTKGRRINAVFYTLVGPKTCVDTVDKKQTIADFGGFKILDHRIPFSGSSNMCAIT